MMNSGVLKLDRDGIINAYASKQDRLAAGGYFNEEIFHEFLEAMKTDDGRRIAKIVDILRFDYGMIQLRIAAEWLKYSPGMEYADFEDKMMEADRFSDRF